MGIWCGAPFGAGYYIWKSMIPTLLGNIVGGGFFVGAVYWYLYLTGDEVAVTFDTGSLATAMDVGGPMGNASDRGKHSHGNDHTIDGVDPAEQGLRQRLPQPGYQMMSALGKELSDDSPYVKKHAERVKQERESSSEEKV
ncbi:hypothetical protein LTR53_008433 [Teratosphaeriaceae sp. CCFEE 6253]|nr:hypothetical protein LTR53_000350 [Teratosphaeriaceae sp. CCFEE 6253]KAK3113858.1 hypothetical protein LTR53_008433 [Teratosphaeriaceae sp. CCFEE 6253]